MYQQQQPQQALPFDPWNLQFPFPQFQHPNPPFIPQINVDQWMQPAVPYFTSAVMKEIHGRAIQQPARPWWIFFYNRFAQNYFNNPDFVNLVHVALLYCAAEVRRGQSGNMQQAAEQRIGSFIESAMADQFARIPALHSLPLNPQMQNMLPQLQNQWRDMLALATQAQTPVNQQPQQNGHAQYHGGSIAQAYQTGGQVSMGNQDMSWNSITPQFSNGQGQQHNWDQPAQTPANGGFDPMSRHSPVPVPVQNNVAAPVIEELRLAPNAAPVYNSGAAIEQPFHVSNYQAAQYPVLGRPMTTAEEAAMDAGLPVEKVTEYVREKDSPWDWAPTPEQPHPFAHHTSSHAIYHSPRADGTAEQHLIETLTEMNYDEHQLSNTFGKPPAGEIFGPADAALGRVSEGLTDLEAAKVVAERVRPEDVADEVVDEFDQVIRPGWDTVSSLQEAWFNATVARAQVGNETPTLYLAFSRLANPVIVSRDVNAEMRFFAESTTFVQLAKRLRESRDKLDTNLWYTLNDFLTTEINRIIKQNLSLAHLYIDHFVDDMEELMTVMESRHGAAIVFALSQQQRRLIEALMGFLDGEGQDIYVKLVKNYQQLPAETELHLAVPVQEVSLTLINCMSHELQLELYGKDPAVGAAVHRSNSPVLQALLKTIFTKTDEMIKQSDGKILHHYLRTIDGRVLEASRGFLGEDYFLLSLVK